MPATIAEEQNTFSTKVFLIRYCEEEVDINDTVLFRAEIDVADKYLDSEFYLDFDLYFADVNSLGGADNWKQFASNVNNVCKFSRLQQQTYLIKALPRSIIEFCPVTFSGNCFSVLNVQVQSVLIDYKFRPNSNNRKFSNVTEFLFADEFGKLPESPDLDLIDQIFNAYKDVMVEMSTKMKLRYNTFLVKFLTQEQRDELGLKMEHIENSKQVLTDNLKFNEISIFIEETKSEDLSEDDDSDNEQLSPQNKDDLKTTAVTDGSGGIEEGRRDKSFIEKVQAGEIKSSLTDL